MESIRLGNTKNVVKENCISTAVTTDSLLDFYIVGLTEEGIYCNVEWVISTKLSLKMLF